jgi:hypothetical protein
MRSATTSQNMKSNSNQSSDQLLYSRRDAARILGGICTDSVDNYIRRGDLRAVQVGGRVFIHRDELNRVARNGTR